MSVANKAEDFAPANNENTRILAQYIGGTKYESLPREVTAKAKHHILDTVGAIVSGSQLECGQLITDFVRQQQSKGDSTVIGSNLKTSPALAALANGTASHADEVDDLHHPSIQHPGCATMPTALAMGESLQTSGKAFIAAYVLGYEITGRVARALNVSVMRKHNHSGLGAPPCIASAAIASHLLGLDERQICSALGLATQQACGTYTWLTEPTHMSKAFDIGVASRNGTTAAQLAKAGFQGPAGSFDQPYSIFDAFSGGERKLEELSKNLGTNYDMLGATIKKYPVGGPIQAPLEGLFQIMGEQNLHGEDIEEITIGTGQESVWLVGKRPISDICMEQMIAAGAYFGKLGWEETHDEKKMHDPAVVEYSKRVKFVADPELEKTFPRIRAAKVTISTKSGKRFQTRVDHVPGTADNPFTQDQVEAKFTRLVEPVLGAATVGKVIDIVANLEGLKNIRELGNLLRL